MIPGLHMNDVLMIGIAGGTASGKSTLTRLILERFPDDTAVLQQDDYYKVFDDIPFEERVRINFDEPAAFDSARMAQDLEQLRSGAAADAPVYDYVHSVRTAATRRVGPAKVVITEGLLVLADPALCALFDLRIFVDADADVRLIRRIRRDIAERGRTADSVMEQYLATVKPMHDRYIEPSKKNADLIIPGGGDNTAALDLLYQKIKNHIEGN